MQFAAMVDEPAADVPDDLALAEVPPRASLPALWIALLSVGTLAALVTAGVLLGRHAPSVTIGKPNLPPKDYVQAIREHPFWRVPVTEDMVAGLVRRIRAEQSNTLVYVDDHFRVEIYRGEHALGYRPMGKSWSPSELSRRCLCLDLLHYAKRPDEAQVLTSLHVLLDAADFEGPR
jgi:hypothetical protein